MNTVEEILEAYKKLSTIDKYKVAKRILNIENESKNGFDTKNMRSELKEVCHNQCCCNFCPIKEKYGTMDCDFNEMPDQYIIEIYADILKSKEPKDSNSKIYRLDIWNDHHKSCHVDKSFWVIATNPNEAIEIVKRESKFPGAKDFQFHEDNIRTIMKVSSEPILICEYQS